MRRAQRLHPRPFVGLPLLFIASLGLVACGDRGETRSGSDGAVGPKLSVGEEDGLQVERLDADGNGVIDIIRYFLPYEDPREPGRMRRRLVKMEIDVNTDGMINVRRHYDEYGNVAREENDTNLDGVMDLTIYFVGGEIARKERFQQESGRLLERKVYYEGRLVRVEKDLNGDGSIDNWEYYEDGVLMRIGRDTVGDGAADTWQFR